MNVAQKLRRLFDVVVAEAERSPAFARRLEEALSAIAPPASAAPETTRTPTPKPSAVPKRRGGRRPPGALDPFVVYQAGEGMLRARLAELTLDQLKDMVAEHGMDPSKLAMKWKKPERLIDLIVATVRERLEKGDAFRA